MSLGERIYKLRTEKGMSQGDLADALEVSRQSISKWETNGSVPELDKLVKLSEIFGVSLDELVLDKKQTSPVPEPEPKVIYVERGEQVPVRKTAGIVLLCFAGVIWLLIALLGDAVSGLVLAAPFVGCGLICVLVKKHPGLWCFWIVYLFVEIYLRFATGVNWQFILSPLTYDGSWTIHLIVAWIVFLTFMALTVFTALQSWKDSPSTLRSNVIGTAASLTVYMITRFVFALPAYEAENAVVYSQAYRYFSAVSGWVRNMVLAVALVFFVRSIAALITRKKPQLRDVT